MRRALLVGLTSLLGCATAKAPPAESTAPAALAPSVRTIALPDAPDGGVMLDYLAFEPGRGRVWVPAGNTGLADVIDAASGQVARVSGFPTAEVERHGHKRVVGPSSAAVGDGVVYVGNRGDQSVCAIDAATLQKGACLKLDSMPDGLAYVAATHELWVTTPRSKSLQVLDASTPAELKAKATVTLEGEPEGYAVDDARGLFFTNLEDADRTLAIDLHSRAVKQSWTSGCGEGGPKGLALDHAANLLLLACPDRVKVLDLGHGGQVLSELETGAGVDNLDYLESKREVFVGAAKAARLTVGRVDAEGKLAKLAEVPTAAGARNPVVAPDGTAFLTDAAAGRILVVPAP
jgi:DNA-binding beta-propeller fold protein YncE